MSLIEFSFLRVLSPASVILYLVFDYLNSKRVKDEREELIQLKSLELSHKVTLSVLAISALVYLVNPAMNALFVIQGLVLSALYTEILGKVFYRSRL
jgi:hypothetical protein